MNELNLKEGFINFLLPQHCVACGRYVDVSSGFPLCEECLSKIPFLEEAFCLVCGRLVGGGNTLFCHRCRTFPFHFDRARAVTWYETPIRECICAFKYQGVLSLVSFLGSLLAEYCERHPLLEGIDYLLPVPLHPRRLRERGFNQALLLGNYLRAHFRIPLLEKAVVRWQDTPPQVGLSTKERRKNVQDAFRVLEPAPLQGTRILILDDVLTSRSTVDALSRVLKEAGCREVLVLAVASGKS
ncbi:MAG: double zinc ribbon domain-containing protein [Candidatus Caldatribacteriaceae bacterium]